MHQTSEPLAPPLEAVWVRLMRAPAAVLGQVQAELKRAGFPPLEWYDALLELSRPEGGRMRQRDLGVKLLIARYNLTRLVDRLEREGLVAREDCPEDARGAILVLTDKGRALRAAMWPAYRKAVERHVGGRLDGDEQRALACLLTKLG